MTIFSILGCLTQPEGCFFFPSMFHENSHDYYMCTKTISNISSIVLLNFLSSYSEDFKNFTFLLVFPSPYVVLRVDRYKEGLSSMNSSYIISFCISLTRIQIRSSMCSDISTEHQNTCFQLKTISRAFKIMKKNGISFQDRHYHEVLTGARGYVSQIYLVEQRRNV